MIKTVDELTRHIPNYTAKTGDEHSSPCPFCAEAEGRHSYVNDDGITFLGEDRLIKFPEKDLFYCRFCRQNGRGRGTQGGTFTLRDLAEILGFHVSRDIEARAIRDERDAKGLDNLIPESEIAEWHQLVKREYWYSIGIDDEIIDHFQLGYAKPLNRREFGHIIPMRLTNIITNEILHIGGGIVSELPAYACEYRRIKDRNPIASKTEKPQFLFKGDSKRNGWFWLIATNEEIKTVIITEGSKDALSALQMGFDNVVTSFGVDHLTRKHIEYLRLQGFDNIIIAGDGDDAGQKFSENLYYYCQMEKINASVVNWDDIDLPPNSDLNDLLIAHEDEAYNTVMSHLKGYEIEKRKMASLESNTKPKKRLTNFIVDQDDMDIIEPEAYYNVWDDSAVMSDLETLRGDGDNSLYSVVKDFVDNYTTYRGDRGAILSVNVPPGIGKTYTTSRIAQELVDATNKEHEQMAREWKKEIDVLTKEANFVRVSDRDKAEELEVRIGKLRTKIRNSSRIAVAWYGPFKAGFEDLERFPVVNNKDWFNFEARHAENCMNISAVQEMGNNNHRIMEYCMKSCKFAQNCAYMKQRKQQDSHPAVYYRHQQLQMEAPSNLKMVVIDESPVHVIEDSVITLRYSKMAYPGVNELSKEQNEHINEGVDVVKTVVKNSAKEKSDTPIFGMNVLALLDEEFKHRGTSLQEWLSGVSEDMLSECEPNYEDSHGTLMPELRWVEDVLRTIIKEYPEYEAGELNNSFIHIEEGSLIAMPLELTQFQFPRNVPIVLLDATGMPTLLEAMFDRKVIEFNPVVKNNNLTTTMVTGSDFTKSHVSAQLKRIHTLEMGGELVTEDVSEYSFDKKINDKVPVLRDILDLLRIETRRHDKILFVTYKSLSDYLKTKITEKAENLGIDLEKVTFAHYGSLRGTNKYELYDTAILFGAYRIPYNVVWRKAMMWSRLLGSKEAIEHEPIAMKAFYPGTNQGSEIWTFEDEFTREYLNMIEVGELRQCADRIRPHNGGIKNLIAVMNRPCLPYVDGVVTYSSYLQQWREKLFLVKDAMPSWVNEHIYKFIMDEYVATSVYPALSYAQRMLDIPDLGRSKYNKVRDYVKQLQRS